MGVKDNVAEYYRRYRKLNRGMINKYGRERREMLRKQADPEELRALTEFRESLGLRKVDFARELGVSKAYVTMWEKGTARINHDRIRERFPGYQTK